MADKLDVAVQQMGEYAERTTDDLIYWHDRALRAEAKVKTLREALQIFADAADRFDDLTIELSPWGGPFPMPCLITVDLAELRAARAALKGGDDED